jgi:hypothetical protein
MTFEDAIAALGEEFGVTLSAEDGTASFEVSSEDGDFEPVNVTIAYEPEDEMLLISADAGPVDLEGGDEQLLKMLEANHMFSGTMGASFSIDDGRAKLERSIRLDAFWREGGKALLMSLLKSVQAWREENKM